MQVQPYLNFDGRCEEAIEFYKTNLGAQVVMLMRFKDNPEPPKPGTVPPGIENKVMHAALRIGDTTLFASDGHALGRTKFEGITLSLSVANDAEAERVFNALANNGGKITMPLAKSFFSSRFGMLADRFGVGWMVSVPTKLSSGGRDEIHVAGSS